jgi:hypothetical protein
VNAVDLQSTIAAVPYGNYVAVILGFSGAAKPISDIRRYAAIANHCRYCSGVGLLRELDRAPQQTVIGFARCSGYKAQRCVFKRQPTVGGASDICRPLPFSDALLPPALCFDRISGYR